MLQDSMNSWKACFDSYWCGSNWLQKVIEVPEEVVVGWQEVR